MKNEVISLNGHERDRLRVIGLVDKGVISPKEGAESLGISARHFRRIRSRHREEGDKGLAHRSRGRPSNKRLPDDIRREALLLIGERYPDFGPTLASEKLAARDGIRVSNETVRKWMIAEGLWKPKRRKERHRARRERRKCFGEMVQMDGSHHDWLEGRAEKMTLIGMIDDATSEVIARFFPSESLGSLMGTLRVWLETHGRPRAIYADRHALWVAQAGQAGEKYERDTTQLRRALSQLGIEFITARSPQAKGRVERLFETLQDRLVKEMRLKEIDNINDANKFLATEYLPWHNRRFRFEPASRANAHRRLTKGFDLSEILSRHDERTVANDYTIRWNNRIFQIGKPAYTGLRGGRVTVVTGLDGTMQLVFKNKKLTWREINPPPSRSGDNAGTKVKKVPGPASPTGKPISPPGPQTNQHGKPWVPPPDHPWRRFKIRAT
jgi:transposase